ncbi:MAG: hypothetical protein ACLUFI_11425 [Oscillospiraceae bacterium]
MPVTSTTAAAVRGQVFADGEDLFALDQHVSRAGSGGGDDGAAFE